MGESSNRVHAQGDAVRMSNAPHIVVSPHLLEIAVIVGFGATLITHFFVQAFRDTGVGFVSRMICESGPMTYAVVFLGYMNWTELFHVIDPQTRVERRFVRRLLVSCALPLVLGLAGTLGCWWVGRTVLWDPAIVGLVVTLLTVYPAYRVFRHHG